MQVVVGYPQIVPVPFVDPTEMITENVGMGHSGNAILCFDVKLDVRRRSDQSEAWIGP